MEFEKEQWNVTVSSSFLTDHPKLNKEQIAEGLLVSPWLLPTLDSNLWIPNMGTTYHKGMPTGIKVPDGGIDLDVFVKPMIYFNQAYSEFTGSEVIRRRGINTPQMVAVIRAGKLDEETDQVENAVLVSNLVHSAEPLSAMAVDYKLTDPRVYKPLDLLNDFVGAIAYMNNQGVTHGDLHLGNIGHQFFEDKPPSVIFFDFEMATILNEQLLIRKNEGVWHSQEQKDTMDKFEMQAVDDLGIFAAHLRHRGFPMRKGKLLHEVSGIYQNARVDSVGLTKGKIFYKALSQRYSTAIKRLNSLKA